MTLARKLGALTLAGLAGVITGCEPRSNSEEQKLSGGEYQSGGEYITCPGRDGNSTVKLLIVKSYKQELERAGIPLGVAQVYDERLQCSGVGGIAFPGTIISLYGKGILPEVANKYSQRFSGDDILFLSTNGITPEVADEYKQRSDIEILLFIEAGISAKEAESYNLSRPYEIIQLKNAGITPEIANKYASINNDFKVDISVDEMITLTKNGFDPEEVRKKARELLVERAIFK